MPRTPGLYRPASPEDAPLMIADFVKKLYNLLQDPSFQHLLSWGPQGDDFTVKPSDQFANDVLQPTFEHNNLAVFVNQLNSYGFRLRGVARSGTLANDISYDHIWTFCHTDFRAHSPASLCNIKLHAPATGPDGILHSNCFSYSARFQVMQHQLDRMAGLQQEMRVHIGELVGNYRVVLEEVATMRSLIHYMWMVKLGRNGGKENSQSTTTIAPSIPTTRRPISNRTAPLMSL
ncbi:kinase-regulated stress-responsive transcription factor skn7 [Steccherinum ochraceum]|uniref:Kinase-regulated stress-responsive transcription factor skn7 n=1 Tax=Steccherinum ochraceum TaxID=92696 RepID=A0A4R0R9U1_9APHY|nr:kinase-regulated stress-responsive transcription factor skn7 [Steccherinum ochraceum]